MSAEIKQTSPDISKLIQKARAYINTRNFTSAQKLLEQAIAQDQTAHAAWAEMGMMFYQQKKYEHAALLLHKAITLSGENDHEYQHLMSLVFSEFVPAIFNQTFKDIVLHALNTPHILHGYYDKAWNILLVNDPEISKILAKTIGVPYEQFCSVMDNAPNNALLTDPFFSQGLQMLKISQPEMEQLCKHLRRYFLEKITADQFKTEHEALLFALAEQCFFNEYVFACTDEEETLINDLIDQQDFAPEKLAIIGCYRPLYEIRNLEIKPHTHNLLKHLIRTQIEEPLYEQKIKQNIKTIDTIKDHVSKNVQTQYEQNPYPRWKDHALITQKEGHARANYLSDIKSENVLIAGCGTGKQIATNRLYFPEAHITAIDISRASLAYAIRKCEEFKFKNIDFYQADILELEQLDKSFDFIACTGVLHHMDKPLEGWRVLNKILRPGGHMRIALYSELARAHIVKAREMIAEQGFNSNTKGIRECRSYIMNLPPGDQVKKVVQSSDFYSLSSCRDLIFHVQEHRFTIPMIRAALDELGLDFKTMHFASSQRANKYIHTYPDDSNFENMTYIEEFETTYPNTFGAMYQFLVHKPNA